MNRRVFLLPSLFVVLACLISSSTFAQNDVSHPESDLSTEEDYHFILRYGQGGFRDNRSPLNKLGGGQIAIDIKPVALPVMVSISGEYYTNSPDPTHSYEISDMFAVNVLYTITPVDNKKLNYFFGGGIGRLEVPSDENNPDAREKDDLYNLEVGVHNRYFEKVGFYCVAKYLNAEKTVNGTKLIDFSEFIFLLGLTYNFSL